MYPRAGSKLICKSVHFYGTFLNNDVVPFECHILGCSLSGLPDRLVILQRVAVSGSSLDLLTEE
jgi:hypothetical protein